MSSHAVAKGFAGKHTKSLGCADAVRKRKRRKKQKHQGKSPTADPGVASRVPRVLPAVGDRAWNGSDVDVRVAEPSRSVIWLVSLVVILTFVLAVVTLVYAMAIGEHGVIDKVVSLYITLVTSVVAFLFGRTQAHPP